MKKLLTILGTLTLSATPASIVVACGTNIKDAQGKIIIKNIKGLNLELGEVNDFNYKTISTQFYGINSELFPEDSSVDMFYVLPTSRNAALVNGKKGNGLFSEGDKNGVEVKFTVPGTEQMVSLKELCESSPLILDLGDVELSVTKKDNKVTLGNGDYSKISKKFYDINKNFLPSGASPDQRSFYVNPSSYTYDENTKTFTATIVGGDKQKLISPVANDSVTVSLIVKDDPRKDISTIKNKDLNVEAKSGQTTIKGLELHDAILNLINQELSLSEDINKIVWNDLYLNNISKTKFDDYDFKEKEEIKVNTNNSSTKIRGFVTLTLKLSRKSE